MFYTEDLTEGPLCEKRDSLENPLNQVQKVSGFQQSVKVFHSNIELQLLLKKGM